MKNEKSKSIHEVKPVRKIGVRTSQVRGRIAQGQEYESLLERDYLTLLRMEPMVASFVTQPVTIDYVLDGVARTYVPDVLVGFKVDSVGKKKKPLLVEVKPQEYADHPDDELAAKLAAAVLFCERAGWSFEVVTEREIYTPRLTNANFLVRYKDRECDPAHIEMIQDQLRLYEGCATPTQILEGAYQSPLNQAKLLPDLWTLVANGALYANLNLPIDMNSEIWSLRP